jgi:hypothetical protein
MQGVSEEHIRCDTDVVRNFSICEKRFIGPPLDDLSLFALAKIQSLKHAARVFAHSLTSESGFYSSAESSICTPLISVQKQMPGPDFQSQLVSDQSV